MQHMGGRGELPGESPEHLQGGIYCRFALSSRANVAARFANGRKRRCRPHWPPKNRGSPGGRRFDL
jgi:hypothetical protein